LMIALLIPVISSRYCRRAMGVSQYLLVATVLIFTLCMIMSETRSSILLLCFAMVGYLILFSFVQVKSIDSRKSFLGLLIVGSLILVALWNVIGGEYIWNRLNGLDFDQFAISDLTSGERINRLQPFLIGVDRLRERNWIFGFGSGIPESDRMAWFGYQNSPYLDYHSLYLSLPMLYGWAGAGAFIALIVFTAGRCLWAVRRYRKEIHFLTPVCLGLTVFWVLFLVNEYKISILRMANYQMIVWIWLGISHAVVNALKRDAGTDMLDLS